MRSKALKGQTVDDRHGDHIFELQMVKKHLTVRNGLKWGQDVPQSVIEQVTAIVNSRINVAPIDPSTNIQKGQLFKSATAGKAPKKANPIRDGYVLLSYGTSKLVADKLDEVYNRNLKAAKTKNWVSARTFLKEALDSSGILDQPGAVEPPTSPDTPKKSAPAGRRGRKAHQPDPGSDSDSSSSGYSTPTPPQKGKRKRRASSSVSSNVSSNGSSFKPATPDTKGKRKANANAQGGRKKKARKV